MRCSPLLTYRSGSVGLIELLFVTALLGTVGVAIYTTMLFGQQTNLRTEHYTKASQLAADQIELIRSSAYAAINTPYTGSFLGPATTIDQLPNGSAELTVSYLNSPTNSLKKVVATVQWVEHKKLQSVRYTTLIVDQGIGQ